MKRYTATLDQQLPCIAIDLGYSATAKSCGLVSSINTTSVELSFGNCIDVVAQQLRSHGRHTLILEAVLSTYHTPEGNPAIRGDFEKGRGWYHGPGVSTFAAALRFLHELDRQLPELLRPIPIVEGFLSYKQTRTTHAEDAQRLLNEYHSAERFCARDHSQPINHLIDGVPQIRRYNPPPEAQ